jgi:thymidylate kinase
LTRSTAPIIVFSGVDGAGKSTQIEKLSTHLAQHDIPHVHCWSRGGYTPLFNLAKRAVRRLPTVALPEPGPNAQRERLLNKPWIQRIWLTISLLDLALIYAVRIRWWRFCGKVVICDRYLQDTELDFRLNFPDRSISLWPLWQIVSSLCPRPDQAFLMLIPVEETLRRSSLKNEPFPDSRERVAARLEFYERMTGATEWKILDGRKPADALFREILEALDCLETNRKKAD